ncbi:hypothetical protein GCM10022408_14350 [Hymenobacter fastidiosus]|uniref:Uncharacterized protein n=1 Tax=Hymenobacter fastidiosus TaxID=486264 RepID=A0ABP7RY64_9BACT
MLKGWLAGQEPGAGLRFAGATGVLVAACPGAPPAISEADGQQLPAAQIE